MAFIPTISKNFLGSNVSATKDKAKIKDFITSTPCAQIFLNRFFNGSAKKFKANFWHFAALSLLRITQSLYNSYWPAKASRAFLISSGFSRSVITILCPGERDREDMKGTKFGIAFQRGECRQQQLCSRADVIRRLKVKSELVMCTCVWKHIFS